MFRLPPPPRFNLSPPPILSSDIFERNLLFQLTCSSIRQQEQYKQIPKSRLIAISCIAFLIMILLFMILFIIIQLYRQRKSLSYNSQSKPPPIQSNTISMNTSRSYETISSEHTGVYVDSIDTSATTYSTDPSNIICLHCHQERDYSIPSPPPYYHTLDVPS
jgi:hypothetical protein